MERVRGEQDALCAIASPPSTYRGWLTNNVCFCNGQRSSGISCDKFPRFLDFVHRVVEHDVSETGSVSALSLEYREYRLTK
jgi:hypothetical protein